MSLRVVRTLGMLIVGTFFIRVPFHVPERIDWVTSAILVASGVAIIFVEVRLWWLWFRASRSY